MRDTGTCPCESAEQLLRRHLEEIDAEMAQLAALGAELVGMVAVLAGPTAPPPGGCPDPEQGTWCPPTGGGGEPDA